MSLATRLPGDEAGLRSAVEERLTAAGRKGVDGQELIAALAPEWPATTVRRVLARLAAEGVAAEWNRRWLPVAATDWLVGVVRRAEEGFVVRVEEGPETLWAVRSADLKGAGAGDRVLIRPLRRRRGRGGRLPRAAVLRRLERGRRHVVGTLEEAAGGGWRLVPFDPQSRQDLAVEGGDGLDEDDYVVVEVAEGRRGAAARGRVVEVLGSAARPGVDVAVVLRHYEIPEEFPAAVAAAAAALPAHPTDTDLGQRQDLRGQLAVTIDGETARDFDDAVSVEETSRGWRVGVHIADVAHYVAEGSELDLEAYRRGTSVYFPDRAVPMLPEALSNGLCSLRPEVPRLTLSALLDFDRQGALVRRRFRESVIRSRRRLTYDEVARLLTSPAPGDEGEYGDVLGLLQAAERLMQRLLERRLARGSIDFDLPEGDVVLDTEGFTVGVRPERRTVAHRIIEELMIAANEAVAAELEGAGVPVLYRIHEPPGEDTLGELREILAPLGLELEGDLSSLHPSALQAVLRRVEGRPEEPFVSSLVLRAMQRAVYDPEPKGHYALASRHYTHFTSPIRRYPDLVVHRQLKAWLAGRAGGEALAERLPAIAAHTSTTERRAERAERELLQWKLVRLLAGRVGERFAGRISGVQPFGLFVQLSNYFVDGLVPIRSMADDYYVYDPVAHTLTGSEGGRTFRLADEVEVELTGVSQRHRGLDLTIAGMPAPAQRGRRKRRDGAGGRDRTAGGRDRGGGGRRDRRRGGRKSGGAPR